MVLIKMTTKITYPNKLTGDPLPAPEFNQIKSVVNGTVDNVTDLQPKIISDSLDLTKLNQTILNDGLVCLNFILDKYTGEIFSFKEMDPADYPAAPDGVIHIQIGTKYYKRQYTGLVNVKWFGAVGDGLTDDSAAVQSSIEAFRGVGASILFPEGTFMIKDIQWPAAISIVSLQLARDNFLSNVQSKITAAPGATYIFEFEDDAKNCLMNGLFIDGDYNTNPNLTAAIRWAGTFNKIINCNVTRCAQYAIKSKCGGMVLQDNNIQGWFGAAPTDWTGDNDFRGAFHAEAMGDSYVLNNEIGAGLPYFTPTVTPRDPIHGRIVAMSLGNIFGGTSVISGNLFENGDRAVAIGNSLYCNFNNNRYELSAMGGLYIYGPMQFASFSQERFADNSLSEDGAFDDITIATGAAGNIALISPTFESLVNGSIPNSNFKVKYHISNYGSTLINLITPVIDPIYSVNGLINLTDVGTLPIRQVQGQYDPNNPIWLSVSTKQPVIDSQKGYVKLTQGSANTAEEADPDNSLLGAIQFYNASNDPKAIIGFNTGNDLWFNMPGGSPGTYVFIGGALNITKPGGNILKVISTDLEGAVEIGLEAGPATDFVFNALMDPDTGETTIVGNGDIVLGLNDNIKVSPTGETYFPFVFPTSTPGSVKLMAVDNSTRELVSIDPGSLLVGYTVATLPAGAIGMTAYVIDATTPTYLGSLTGGGTVVCPVFYDGTSWKSH
jgi:hypothetical protein